MNTALSKETKNIVARIKDRGTRKNTDKARASDLEYFWAWADLSHNLSESYPVPWEIILDFVARHLEGNFPPHIEEELLKNKIKQKKGRHKLKTVMRRLSTLSWKHNEVGVPKEKNPVFHHEITELIKKAADDPTHARKPAQAADKAIILKVLEDIDDDIFGKRDRALMAVTWASGGRRRSESLQMTMESRTIGQDKNGSYYIFELSSVKNKKNTDSPLKVKISGIAKDYLDDWLDSAAITSGYIFRQMSKGGKSIKKNPISGTQFYRIVKKRFLQAGIKDPERFSPHSLRSGFITEFGKQGGNVGDGMAVTGHRCLQTFMSYYQAGEAETNTASSLLDGH